jgi:hypothetical protein
MTVNDFFTWLQATSAGTYVRESDWAFPTLESIHVVFLTLVFGSIILLDLRLTGLGYKKRSVSSVTNDVMMWTWCGFVGAAITGGLLFSSAAVKYYEDWATRGKFTCMGLAGINMLVYEFLTHPSIAKWDNDQRPPARVRAAGFISMALWVGVIVFGRWIGFSTQDQNGG